MKSNLPPLPRVTKQREASSSVVLRSLIESGKLQFSSNCSIEMKDTRGESSLPFDEVTDDQITYGHLISSDKGVLIRVQGLKGEPDYIYMRNALSYIVIKYPKFFVIIDVYTFFKESTASKRRSLTEKRAQEIAFKVIHR